MRIKLLFHLQNVLLLSLVNILSLIVKKGYTMKTVTKKFLKKHGACPPGFRWFSENCLSLPIDEQLLKLNEYNPCWACWLLFKLLNRKDRIRLAVFRAELCEPESELAKNAITAAKNVIKRDSEKNRDLAEVAFNVLYSTYAFTNKNITCAMIAANIASGGEWFFHTIDNKVINYAITLVIGRQVS